MSTKQKYNFSTDYEEGKYVKLLDSLIFRSHLANNLIEIINKVKYT